MEEIPISKFKATCLAVLEKVRRTGQPIRITRFGKPVAEVIPPAMPAQGKVALGGLEGKLIIHGDIVSPAVDPWEWEVLRDEAPAGYSHLGVERQRSSPRQGKGARRARKR
jgi:prevent-host-death family protein